MMDHQTNQRLRDKIREMEAESAFLIKEIDYITSDLIKMDSLYIEEQMKLRRQENSFRFFQLLHQEISSSKSEKDIYEITVISLIRNLGFDSAIIYKKQDDIYHPVAFDGYASDDMAGKLSDPFFATSVEQDGTLLVNGEVREPCPENFINDFQVKYFIATAFTLSLRSAVPHILFVGNRTEETVRRPRLTKSDAENLQTLCKQVAVSIENITLCQDLEIKVRERTHELRQEISERKRAQAALSQANSQLNTLLEAIPDIIYFKNACGRNLVINKAFEKFVGMERETIIGKTDAEIIPPKMAAHCQASDNKVISSRKPVRLEETFKRESGEQIYFETIKIPIFDETASLIGLVGVSRDITERKKMAEELLKARQLESIGILAGGIAHDFNNMLTVIMGNISMAEIEIPPDNRARLFLKRAEKASAQSRQLTKKLITFSRGGEPVKKSCNIRGLLKRAANLALTGSATRCQFSIPDDLPPVQIEESQISQAIRNVLINAREAMTDGGSVSIIGRTIHIAGENPNNLKEGHYIVISITDQGQGIPRSQLGKIFDPYFSTKEMGSRKGMGLGLSIAHSVISKHNGMITAESGTGVGTIFRIYLPAEPRQAQPQKCGADAISRAVSRRKILLMDDEEMVRDIAGQMLTYLGYEAEFAGEGGEAIEKYRAARASGTPFDAIIMDLNIADGMDGETAIRSLLAVDPDVVGIVSSGYSTAPVMNHYRDYGFKGKIAKPYRLRELKAVLVSVLEESESEKAQCGAE
ncbi:hypothetical protein DENIS_1406 [Desulfonema ishimotonii]|uniref:histidine kinase n=1 Tax=Desulfonema ishimotonii TaxID=45657 RepID=A0A401FU17_9BACT|nr:ATP-binding protein [Desulfonema ishimotonii]GBC60453.1 hypothetical protein DENIS_1406 [Desulfonema ishimotonii]